MIVLHFKHFNIIYVLGMTKIYKFQDDISTDALRELEKNTSLALDTEGSGLQIPHRDKLSLVQLSTGRDDAYIIQPDRKNYKAPNLVKLLENLPVQRIIEIGPAYGVPTALLANAGFEVTTFDFMERGLLGDTMSASKPSTSY